MTTVRASPVPSNPISSPSRPSYLPVAEPVPVPTMKEAFKQMKGQNSQDEKEKEKEEPHTPTKVTWLSFFVSFLFHLRITELCE